MDLLIATGNPAKVREIRQMLGREGAGWADLSQFDPPLDEVPETASTFRENACLKATGYAVQSGSWTLADDSGLVVDALGGQPGVLSARWASFCGSGKGDADNNDTLLKQLEAVADHRRTARFVCVLALADPSGRIILTSMGTVEGRVVRQPRGLSGFGYDPLFLVDSLDRTTAELMPEQKHAISHRGRALARLRGLIQRVGLFAEGS